MFVIILFAILTLVPLGATAATPAPAPPTVAAWLPVDRHRQRSGAGGKERRAAPRPASLTKIMTSYVLLLGDRKRLGQAQRRGVDQRKGGRRRVAHVHRGEQAGIGRRPAKGMIIQSGNDASVALAEHAAGERGGIRQPDERPRPAARPAGHAFRERHRPAGPRPLHHAA